VAAVDGVELRGLVASSQESARAAAQAHHVDLAFDNVADLAGREEIDLIVVSVKVPEHRALVLPALAFGKPVFCEWPLATSLAEAEELLAAAGGVRTFIGLQGRSSPVVRYLRDLVAEGYVGEVLSTTLIGSGGIWGPTIHGSGLFLLDRDKGATMLTIPFGHTIDSVAAVLGGFTDLKATSATRRSQVTNTDTGDLVPMTAEDQVAITGILANGAVAAVHYRGGASEGTTFLWEINGTEGDLQITSPGDLNQGHVVIRGSSGGQGLTELTVPSSYDDFPGLRGQPAHAVAHAYAQIRLDLTDDTHVVPDFAHARQVHQLLDAIQQSSAQQSAASPIMG
jgi:predicted dehydrogenase